MTTITRSWRNIHLPRVWATVLLLVAAMLAGCGASASATVIDSVEAVRNAENVRFVSETEGEVSGTSFHPSVERVRSGSATQMTLTITVNGVDATFELISTATRGYGHKPDGGCFPAGWYEDAPYIGTPSAFESPIELAFAQFPGPGVDPDDFFTTELIGRETIGGIAMERFSVDLFAPQAKTYGLVTRYDMWVDDIGRPRQIRLERWNAAGGGLGLGRFFGNRVLLALLAASPDIAFSGEMKFSAEIQFFDFGLPVDIIPLAETRIIPPNGLLFSVGTCPR